MNVRVTTFKSPFSFFCTTEGLDKEIISLNAENLHTPNNKRKCLSDVNHGQYVAVMWENKWTRGIVSMETQFLIWLVDYGIYIRPNSQTVYVDLPVEYKQLPTIVFEASIHGVTPVDKVLSEDCQIENATTTSWNEGASERAQALIKNASKVYFVPLALLSTKYNEIVLGDLYLNIPKQGIVKLANELEKWPIFLEKNKEVYIEKLAHFYTSSRKHRACSSKPDFIDSKFPLISLETLFDEYNAICNAQQEFHFEKQCILNSEDGSTCVDVNVRSKKVKNKFQFTPGEIKKYSNQYITIAGREYNVLNVLVNKMRDLEMCERYKDDDVKSIGRGCSRRSYKI